MGAYDGLSSFFDAPLTDYAIKYNYDDSNVLILEGDYKHLQRNHLTIYNNLLSCKHHSDKRSPIQYGQDLVASWIFEDYFLEHMQNSSFSITLSGADRNRMILSSSNTSTASDFLIRTSENNEYLLELINDYTGFWARTHKLHLRDNKYNQLKSHRSILLAIALAKGIQKFAVFDFRSDVPTKYLPEHPYWHKPAYELKIDSANLYDFSAKNVQHQLLKIL